MWLVESKSKSIAEICDDSTSWGNYYNASFTYTNTSRGTSTKSKNSGTIIPTGSADYTKANNIYDLAGNVNDWTMEAEDTYTRRLRGGEYYDNGYGDPASSRALNYVPNVSDVCSGCRAVLWVLS